MRQLIEDMLKLPQVSRRTLRPEALDFSALVQGILDDLQGREPQRRVNLRVEPEVRAKADAGLLRLALENLLGNAWKFSGKTAEAEISAGVLEANGTAPLYFIQDNGAGFNMD
jgi:light-regulated signal transduction histidine kinase (bacteriophytochrome)